MARLQTPDGITYEINASEDRRGRDQTPEEAIKRTSETSRDSNDMAEFKRDTYNASGSDRVANTINAAAGKGRRSTR